MFSYGVKCDGKFYNLFNETILRFWDLKAINASKFDWYSFVKKKIQTKLSLKLLACEFKVLLNR